MTLPIRLLVLDIDGVLNSSAWWKDREEFDDWVHPEIDPRAVALLNVLAPPDRTRIVVSSTWRLMGRSSVAGILERVGVLARVVGVTPQHSGAYKRGEEIAEWLGSRSVSEEGLPYVILDDDFDAGLGHEGKFVKTDVRVGLTSEDVAKAFALYNLQEAVPQAVQPMKAP